MPSAMPLLLCTGHWLSQIPLLLTLLLLWAASTGSVPRAAPAPLLLLLLSVRGED